MVLDVVAPTPTPMCRAAGREAAVPKRERTTTGKADDRSPADRDVTARCDKAVGGKPLHRSVDGEALDDAIEVELRSRKAEDERAGDANAAPASGSSSGRRTLLV